MRSIICIVFLLATVLAQAQPVKRWGQLSVKGTRLVDAKGAPVLLRGTSFGWDNWHPRYYNEAAVRWLARDWKVSVVRAAMGIEPEGAYKDSAARSIARVEAVIRGAVEAGIYVIVDWHSHNRNDAEAKAFFSTMARKWGRYPNVIWEIFNEPDQESWADVKAYASGIIRAIRAEDPDNLILVGCPHWNTDLNLVAQDPIRAVRNIMYTMHFYAAAHKQYLRDRCDGALAKGIPLFISECGSMEPTGDGRLDLEEWGRFQRWAEARGISWVIWSVSDKYESCSVLWKGAAANGGWQESDLKPWGVFIRRQLRALNP
ncbi:MAG: glycoside hydrolase family 5 protein [Chitinophagaceae bacterium]|nr:MAG: glycoside hydrolase family 5 protein [Chitinophagaceae bacterium]